VSLSARARALPLALFAVLASLTVVASVALRNASNEQEQRLLHERAGEVGALLTSSIGSIGSSLEIVGSVYQTTREATDFEASAAPLVARGAAAVAVVETGREPFVVRAAAGRQLAKGDVLGGQRAALVKRAAAATGAVSTTITGASPTDRRLAFAVKLPGGSVMYQETPLGPVRATPSTPDSPFNELQGVIYTSATPVPDQILATTTARLPMHGTVASRTVEVGADKWLLVVASRHPLVGSLSRSVPWIVLGLGLFGSLIVSAVIALLLRRRAYALGLVAERTSDLEKTFVSLEAARAAAETANQSKSEFLSRMSHELRTPLNAVLGFAQLLDIEALTEDQHESVTQVIKGGRHLLELINEVLDIARIETGNLALSAEPVLPSDVVSDVIDLVRPLAVERSISITTNLRPIDAYVLADRQRLRQVLLNLLSNAVKYNRIGGTITVGCDQPDPSHLRVTVTDTGGGIPDDLHAKLFQPFERLGAEHTGIEGTGVGLALSRRLAEAMDGTLDFESTVGQGSTFWIELPVVEGPIERLERLNPLTNAVARADTQRHTILYIEDNLANVKLIEHVFAARGNVDIVPAMQGRLGLDLARREQPALVLLDLHLPDIDGRTVLQQLRSDPSTAALPVIVISADATDRQIERLLTDGASAYVTKPIDVAEFLRVVDEFLPTESVSEPNRG
jgi:signal transduction histidine kinase/ActR/RegA family two-component response regulator